MGVVAPGNKEIGSWTFDLLQHNRSLIKLSTVTGFGLVKTVDTAIPTPPYNVNIGTCSFALLNSTKTHFKVEQVLGLALVKYTPPTTAYLRQCLGLAAVKDSAVNVNPVAVKNVGVGTLAFLSLITSSKLLKVDSVVGLALVQYSSPRKEQVFHNTNYGLKRT